jgi:glycosyltransferase involved in cell wall biosynthesis
MQAHGILPLTNERHLLKIFYDCSWGNRVLQDTSAVIALTPAEAQQYRDVGVPDNKIKIIPNGINISEYEQLPAKGVFKVKHKIDGETKIILYVGRINKIKGLDLLVKAYSLVIKQLNSGKTTLVIVGPDDEYIATLKKIIKENDLEGKVVLTGPLYDKNKLEAFVDADIFVLPSNYEIFSIVVLEACACGIPVITTDRCGISDLINNKAGLVVPYDVKALSKAIIHMLQNDKARREFGTNGKLLVKSKFSWTEIVKQIEEIYLECVNNQKSLFEARKKIQDSKTYSEDYTAPH